MINVYAAVAQEERRMISDRTKAGLAAAKARGVKLGGPRSGSSPDSRDLNRRSATI
jgi:DNA invertase Pin-like site-specific DNA recombinase